MSKKKITSTDHPCHALDPSKHNFGHQERVEDQTEVTRILCEDHHKAVDMCEVVGVKANGEGGSEGGRCCHVLQRPQSESLKRTKSPKSKF